VQLVGFNKYYFKQYFISCYFSDQTSVIITNSNPTDFQTDIKAVFEHFNKGFHFNLLPLIFTEPISLISKRGISALWIYEYDKWLIVSMPNSQFLLITTEKNVLEKCYNESVIWINFYLNSVQPVILLQFVTQDTLVMGFTFIRL